jgi:type 1 glutamine amidotransferase
MACGTCCSNADYLVDLAFAKVIPMLYVHRTRIASIFVALFGCFIVAPTASHAAEDQPTRRLLFYHRSAGFEHSVVKVEDGKPCYAETVLRPICETQHWELVSTKDGDIFTPENIAGFDAFLFYTTGDLTNPNSEDGSRPMSRSGKQAFLDAIHNGKGFVGFHCASDTFHSQGEGNQTQPPAERDPYINMLGGEFIVHGEQQTTTMTVVDPGFPGAATLGPSFAKHEEWYSLKNFADDLHVILVNETNEMQGRHYRRPPYPATWIRNHGQGRVFYTSMGHREDVWASPEFQSLVIGGITWAVGDAKAATTPNIDSVTPQANELAPERRRRRSER